MNLEKLAGILLDLPAVRPSMGYYAKVSSILQRKQIFSRGPCNRFRRAVTASREVIEIWQPFRSRPRLRLLITCGACPPEGDFVELPEFDLVSA